MLTLKYNLLLKNNTLCISCKKLKLTMNFPLPEIMERIPYNDDTRKQKAFVNYK